jgi:hypothetical protein
MVNERLGKKIIGIVGISSQQVAPMGKAVNASRGVGEMVYVTDRCQDCSGYFCGETEGSGKLGILRCARWHGYIQQANYGWAQALEREWVGSLPTPPLDGATARVLGVMYVHYKKKKKKKFFFGIDWQYIQPLFPF